LLAQWWQQYTQAAIDDLQGDDFPKLINKYLVAMLADRLNLPTVDLDPPDPEDKDQPQPLQTLALLAAIEPLREEILEGVLTSPSGLTSADLPVPATPQWEPTVLPPIEGTPELDLLASRVAPDCFYLRFASFSNFVWFQEIAERYGGDIAQAVLLRGFNYDASARIERMLAMKMTSIAKMFGDQIVQDLAIVGNDLYLKEGASLGVVLAAKNPAILKSALDAERKSVLSRTPRASLEDVEIAGRKVSLLSTPDNRLRSFLVVDQGVVFVTTSRQLVQGFIETGEGGLSLAATPAFQAARQWMPLANDYSIFAYFSPDFFHRLVSPQYQIELRRRLQAIAHLEIAEVAQQAALAEGLQADDLASLQSTGFLPKWFDQRPDGAQTLRSEDAWIDSLRGARGSFLPIADVELQGVTQEEWDAYTQIADHYQRQWRHMDPILLGLRRFQAPESKVERVAVEAYIAPFEADKYGWVARLLGAPTNIEIQLPADDVIALQLHMNGVSTFRKQVEDFHLFAGVKDLIPPEKEDSQGLLRSLQVLRSIPAYIGAWPKPELIELLPLGLGLVRPDAAGYSRMLGGLWRWQNATFSLISFDRSIIENAVPQLLPLETNDWAQARLRVADLSGSLLASWINRQWMERGWRASHGNARLLDVVQQQLKVPDDQVLAVSQRLLDVRLQCPLGGVYELRPTSNGLGAGWWHSTAWDTIQLDDRGDPRPPENYSAPWLDWFRGGRLHATQQTSSLAVVGHIDLEMRPLPFDVPSGLQGSLPTMDFDLFSLPGRLFGAPAPSAEPEVNKKSF
jgi:hypothetical protein